MTYINANPCRNFNHGRSNVSVSYCPECGKKFQSLTVARCDAQKHIGFRKQRYIYCVDCGVKV